jgi:hypothetical protein
VSNEVDPDLETHGLNVRILEFQSDTYPYGELDLALRRNVGVFHSRGSHVLIFDDDHVAPRDMIEAARALLEEKPYVWGHYRYTDFAGRSLEELVRLEPERGRPREHPPNSWHLWMSCYGGMFAAERELLEEFGGFDLIFSGRFDGSDQDLGRRLAQALNRSDRVYIHEPPFAWHPERRPDWPAVRRSNLCRGAHRLVADRVGDVAVERCEDCPYHVAVDGPIGFHDETVIRFDPGLVKVTERAVHCGAGPAQ